MKEYFVEAHIELGRAYKIKANSEKEAKEIVEEDIENYIDEAHRKIELDAMELPPRKPKDSGGAE